MLLESLDKLDSILNKLVTCPSDIGSLLTPIYNLSKMIRAEVSNLEGKIDELNLLLKAARDTTKREMIRSIILEFCDSGISDIGANKIIALFESSNL